MKKIDFIGLRKFSFAILVLIISSIFCYLKIIEGNIFKDILIFLGNGYFLSNIISKYKK